MLSNILLYSEITFQTYNNIQGYRMLTKAVTFATPY